MYIVQQPGHISRATCSSAQQDLPHPISGLFYISCSLFKCPSTSLPMTTPDQPPAVLNLWRGCTLKRQRKECQIQPKTAVSICQCYVTQCSSLPNHSPQARPQKEQQTAAVTPAASKFESKPGVSHRSGPDGRPLINWLQTPYSSTASAAGELWTQRSAPHLGSQQACSPGQRGGWLVPAPSAVLEPGQSWEFWGGPEQWGSRWKPSGGASPPAARTCAGRAAGTWPWAVRRDRPPCTSWPGPAQAEHSCWCRRPVASALPGGPSCHGSLHVRLLRAWG